MKDTIDISVITEDYVGATRYTDNSNCPLTRAVKRVTSHPYVSCKQGFVNLRDLNTGEYEAQYTYDTKLWDHTPEDVVRINDAIESAQQGVEIDSINIVLTKL